MSDKTILVTGGAGYIGSHACKVLSEAGYLPVTYDNLTRGHDWAVKWGPLEQGDIRDRPRLDAVFVRYRPAAVMHFAAYAYVGESFEEPELYRSNNVAGSLTLLDAMTAAGVRAIVFSSSCTVYGMVDTGLLTEDLPFAPISPYGENKVAVERALMAASGEGRLDFAALRYFNAAGAAPGDGIGEDHEPETHLIPRALGAITGRFPPLTVFGEDYDTPDGTCIRDYIHVLDLAEAHRRALEHLLAGRGSLQLNLGTGQGHSVREVIATAERVTGRAVPHAVGPRRPGDATALVADPSKAAAALGWRARRAALAEQVADAWAWTQAHFGTKVAS